MAHETQVRVAVICFLTVQRNVVVLLAALYVILRPVDRSRTGSSAVPSRIRSVMAPCDHSTYLARSGYWVTRTYFRYFNRTTCKPWRRLYIAARISMLTMSACHFSDWPRPFAHTCGSSRNYIPRGWRFRCDFISMVCDLCLYFPGFSKLQ